MTRLVSILCALGALACVVASSAGAAPGRVAVGLGPDADVQAVASSLEAVTGGTLSVELAPLDALVLAVPDVDAARPAALALPGVTYVEPIAATRSLAFVPTDPLVPSQWYLRAIRAFDHWAARPPHPPVRVAVIDSGIDGGHPEFARRIARARSFVGGSPLVDRQGHGTIVAGEIAAAIDNEAGIAGTAPSVELLIGKVVGRDGQISILAEARAIRWAVDNGARVINLSLGGPRDPGDRSRDTYSRLEHAAVNYATRRGVVVVAAAGNCALFRCPERYASWPAALPHVIGVGALRPDSAPPAFSNRDRLFLDLAAPGTDIASTFPRGLSAGACMRGYTGCGSRSARDNPQGTSFAAPLVTAAAAVVLAERGMLGLSRPHSSQVRTLLERTAADVGRRGRDSGSGFGRLDVAAAAAAAAGELPPKDGFETNDDAGSFARTLGPTRRALTATLDRFDDPRDVYRVTLRRGQRLTVALEGPAGGASDLFAWRPGTRSVVPPTRATRNLVARSARPGSRERISFRARRSGWHYVEVRLAGGRSGAYALSLVRR